MELNKKHIYIYIYIIYKDKQRLLCYIDKIYIKNALLEKNKQKKLYTNLNLTLVKIYRRLVSHILRDIFFYNHQTK